MQQLLVLLALSFMAVSCGNYQKDVASFEQLLEADSGQAHKVAKHTGIEDYVVFKNEVTGVFTAYNIKNFDRKKMVDMASFLAVADSNDVITNLVHSSEWVESGYWETVSESRIMYVEEYNETCDCIEVWAYPYFEDVRTGNWIDTSGYQSFYSGGGFKFNNTSTGSKDLETLAALSETAATKFISLKLSSELSLSTNRADELARLATRYNKMESTRELTASEKDAFALEALGVSMKQVEASLKERSQGNEKAFEELMEKAALHNRTTPEKLGTFFAEYVDGNF